MLRCKFPGQIVLVYLINTGHMKIAQKIKNGIKNFETSAKDIDKLGDIGDSKEDEVLFVFGKHERKVSFDLETNLDA